MKVFYTVVMSFFSAIVLAQNTEGSINGLVDNFNIKLYSIQSGGTKVETDGTRAKFGASYCACVDGDDALKFMGSGIENISLLREGASLVIEARPYVTAPDTLYLKMEGMSIGGSYEFQFTPTNFDTSVAACRIYDHFLNKDTLINLSTVSSLPFEVTAVAGSDAVDRFSIVFYPTLALPVNAINIGATKTNAGITINWENVQENNVYAYDIEKSFDGKVFGKLHSLKPEKSILNKKHSFIDKNMIGNEKLYYRIKITREDATHFYSKIVAVNTFERNEMSFQIYPNPVKNGIINMNAFVKQNGVCNFSIINSLGCIVFAKDFESIGINGQYSFQLPSAVKNGLYIAKFENGKGAYETQMLLIER